MALKATEADFDEIIKSLRKVDDEIGETLDWAEQDLLLSEVQLEPLKTLQVSLNIAIHAFRENKKEASRVSKADHHGSNDR